MLKPASHFACCLATKMSSLRQVNYKISVKVSLSRTLKLIRYVEDKITTFNVYE